MKKVETNRTSVSSSKISAILNRNRYRDVVQQYLYDTKQIKADFTATSRQKMQMGTMLEPVIKKVVEDHFGIKLTVDKNRYMHDDYDFFRIEFDALDDKNKIIYEFKNTEQDEDHLLEMYYPQVQCAMFIRGWDKARICYLRNGWDLGFIEVDRDENFIENMILAGIYYWKCLQMKEQPDPEYVDSIAAQIKFYQDLDHRKGFKEPADLTAEDIELLHEWGKLKRQINELEIEEASLKGHFVEKWGTYKDEYINYSNAEYERKGTINLRELQKDFPDIDIEKYREPPKKYKRQTLRYKLPAGEEDIKINREDIV